MDVDAVLAAFKYYDEVPHNFPIKLMIAPTSDGEWAVDMLVSD